MQDKQVWLDEALARGVITTEQREAMADIGVAEKTDADERFRGVGNMNELFVTFGVAMLLSAVGGLTSMLAGPYGSLFTLAITYYVALRFHDGRRYRLPLIFCSISAASSLALSVLALLGYEWDKDMSSSAYLIAMATGFVGLSFCAARFRLPFLMLPIGIVFTAFVTYAAKQGANDVPYRLLLAGCGLCLLVVAVRFDLKDPRRLTRWSDFAFWTYILGSPLFVHALFMSVLLGDKAELMDGYNLLLLGAMAVLVTVSGLLLNRRALIMSTMAYVGYLIWLGLASVGGGDSLATVLLTLGVIGLYMISLGARWNNARRWLFRRLPRWAWLRRFPLA